MHSPISKLGIGPMSGEVVEATFRYSAERNAPLMLIASKNQVDWNGGYVEKWTTKAYAQYVDDMRKKYPAAKVYVCRDHCGPGFNGIHELADVYKTIDADLDAGFDLIHVDFCHFKGSREELFLETKKAITYIRKQKPDMRIEIGTDENVGSHLTDVSRINEDMERFTDCAPIEFYVVETGSLVKETEQAGTFNAPFIQKIRTIADKHGLRLKEHNADYLSSDGIAKRRKLIDAMNVAPQYGALQTQVTLTASFTYGIDPSQFLEEAYASGKWKKWLHKNTAENKLQCAVIAGHYVFAGDAYKRLYERITRHEDLRESIITAMMRNFDLYLQNLL